MSPDPVTITPYRDGPLLVRGPFTLRRPGRRRDRGRPRDVVALCRCGKSRIRPFCDGTPQARRASRRPAEPAALARAPQRAPAASSRRAPTRPSTCAAQRAVERRRARARPSRTSARQRRAPGAPGRRRGRPRRCSRARRRPRRARRRSRSRRSSKPSRRRPLRVAAVGDRRGHLEQRQVADDRPAPAAVQAEQRHQVDRGQRDARDVVEVGAVGVVEARARASSWRTAAAWMRSARPPPYSSAWISTSAAFGRAAQARDRPRVRVGLLELVGRAVHEELEHLLAASPRARCAATATGRRRRRRSRAGRGPSPRGAGALGRRADRVEQRVLEARRSSRRAARSSDGSHSHSVVDAVEAAVVQLVAGRTARAGGPRRRAGPPERGTATGSSSCGGSCSSATRRSPTGPRGAGSDGMAAHTRARPTLTPRRSASASHAPAAAPLGSPRLALRAWRRCARPARGRASSSARTRARRGRHDGSIELEQALARSGAARPSRGRPARPRRRGAAPTSGSRRCATVGDGRAARPRRGARPASATSAWARRRRRRRRRASAGRRARAARACRSAGAGAAPTTSGRARGRCPPRRPSASSSANASQLAIAGGTPWRGSGSAIFGRIEARPVSRPSWNGALAASAASSGR